MDEGELSSLLKKFFEMVRDFQNQAATANDLLRTYLHLENPMYWRQGKVLQTGKCGPNNSIRYFYHGSGCRVETKHLLIDWDYGFDGRTDGFDLWRLRCFAKNWANKYPEFSDNDLLKIVFQEVQNKRLVHQPFLSKQDDLFYLDETQAEPDLKDK
ncbi:MAG: hypothetical protein JNM09_07615 [Blastocatellia bacterium]|nr:hypothetical protein [Blastocatellia bacterium]